MFAGSQEVDARIPQPLIVVGVDGSEGSDAAVRWAVEEARLHGDTVEALSVWPVSFVGHGPAMPPVDGVTAESTAARQVEAAPAGTVGAGDVPVDVTCLSGNPGVVLREEAASKPADLVVIGRTREYLGYEILAGVGEPCRAARWVASRGRGAPVVGHVRASRRDRRRDGRHPPGSGRVALGSGGGRLPARNGSRRPGVGQLASRPCRRSLVGGGGFPPCRAGQGAGDPGLRDPGHS